ncbi:preprotein translocase subunit SecE [Mycolicibacterium sarraceniae]|uniref:Protein translocase subunit SecE n=1 Tax=Mycolicibacterium sarraceniae TaxID=1534348 RepID=A0A7I7SR83_9MYCO|nr:preprotein translocase subunit SecE [Mycolicibacterium sarraceniae]BBY59318.1 protein translocase subunit SecE [Mycolicibacterium sarraceniae]
MSDERDSADAAGEGGLDGNEDTGGETVVVTRPARPTGKRSRRAGTTALAEPEEAESTAEELGVEKDKSATKAKKKKAKSGPSRNPFLFVWNYLKQVVAELRKVIWPNRKQMVSYTTVVLLFLAFMVALIGGVDLGLAKLVLWVFG